MERKKYKKIIVKVLIIILVIIYIMPLLVTITNSFMSQGEVNEHYSTVGNILHPGDKFVEMHLIPNMVSFKQYWGLLFESPVYLNMFWNSVKIALPVVIGNLIVSSMAAYGFTVLKFKGKEFLFFIYIIVMLLPLQVTLMPNYLMADWLNIKDSYLAIILPGIFQPFGTFLLRQSMKMIPKSYIESAQTDGAGHFKIFIYIVIPMVKSGLAAAAMLTLIDYWNLIDQAVVFIQNNEKQPLSLFLANINTEQIGVSFAGAVFFAFPILLVLLWGQDFIRDGINLSGVKG